MKRRVTLYPDDGKVITDGTHYTDKGITLAVGADESSYYEITQAEYDAIMAEKESWEM